MLRAGRNVGAGPVWALGAVADGEAVQAAMLLTDGVRILEFGETARRDHSAEARAALDAARGCWPDAPEIERAARHVEAAVADLAARFPEAQAIGFQGAMLAHDPGGRRTLAGDGARIAARLGRSVTWDFHSADLDLGGAGAPMAAFFHVALAKWLGAEAPIALVSLGETAALTWIDPRQPTPETPGACLAFETGPGPDPGRAAAGRPDMALVADLLGLGFFTLMPPKTLPAPDLARIEAGLVELSPSDAAATRNALAIAALTQGLAHCPTRPARLLIAGGGAQGAAFARSLAADTGLDTQQLDSDGAGIEAQAMAYLALRTAGGLPTSCPATTGVAAAVGGGLISTP